MKKKLRGLKRSYIQPNLSLYRVDVPIRGLSDVKLSVADLWPERAEKTIMFVHGYAGCAETWEYQINHFARGYCPAPQSCSQVTRTLINRYS